MVATLKRIIVNGNNFPAYSMSFPERVVHTVRSCKPYSVGQYDLKRLLMERLGIPSVIIEADITDSRVCSEEQTRTRLEAFFEAIGN